MKLHDYQLRAVEHLHLNPRAGLFMDMGLGKTATVLTALSPNHLPALVVAPKRVAEQVWPEERGIWRPDLSLSLAAGVPKKREAALQADADITVIGRDNLADVPVGRYRTIVLDELSSFKSHASARFKTARKLVKSATYVWGLTGTPAPNGYLDLWSQVGLLDNGYRLDTSIGRYRDRYFTETGRLPGSGVVVGWDLRPGARQRIDDLIGDICLSFLADDFSTVHEPHFNTVRVPNPVRGLYQQMKNNLCVDLDLIGPGAIHTASNAGVLSNRLSQITAGFLYGDEGGATSRLHDEKTKAVQEIVDGTGSPVMVFYRYTEERDRLRRAIPQSRTIDEVKDLQRAWNAGDVPVLLAHPDAIGHGLNLQRGPGHTAVFTSVPWSLEAFEQSVKRLARQGQARQVTIHLLTMSGTVDEAITTALINKSSVQKALLKYLSVR